MARREYRLTPKAEADLRSIWLHIAAENESAADALLLRLFDRFDLVLTHPEMGVARPELSATARILVDGNYLAVYEPADFGILIVAVVHGMRNPANWLKS